MPSGIHLGHFHVLWRYHGMDEDDPDCSTVESSQKFIVSTQVAQLQTLAKRGQRDATKRSGKPKNPPPLGDSSIKGGLQLTAGSPREESYAPHGRPPLTEQGTIR